MGAQSLYNFRVFPYAQTHSTEIFVGAAMLYFVGFGLMCLFVREGRYPISQTHADTEWGAYSAIKTFAVECHSSSHYWYQWLINIFVSFGNALGGIGSGALSTFSIAYYLAIGLNPAQMGALAGTIQIVTGVLIIGSGWLADRYHPIRAVIVGSALGLFIATPLHLLWLFWHPDSQTTFWVNIAMAGLIIAPTNALTGLYDPPLLMRLFPRSRYGQFCANNAIWRSIGGFLGPIFAGRFLDWLTGIVGKEKAYLFIPFWQLAFGIPAFWLLLQLYKSWKIHGGDENYIPPLPTT
jgi:maltose/moltooligosaccharide transporter